MARKMRKRKPSPRLHARRLLYQYASLERFPDGWLPPERELCEELGVSRGTLRKALVQLRNEGYVVSVPPKGNLITGAPPLRSVGVVLGDGGFSEAAVSIPHMLSGVLDVLGDAGCSVRLLNPKSPDKVEELFKKNALDGLVWCYPPKSALSLVTKILKRGDTPLVVATLRVSLDDERIPFKDHATLDYERVGRMRAEYFADRGRKRIAYLGDEPNFITYRVFAETLVQMGLRHDSDWHIEDVNQIAEILPGVLKAGVDGIVSNGGPDRLESLFRTLEKIGEGDRVDLLVDHVPSLPDIMKRHPGVRVQAINQLPHHEIGSKAVKLLLDKLDGEWDGNPVLLGTRVEVLGD